MRAFASALGAVLIAGCALTSKAPPVEIRYFSPETFASSPEQGEPPVAEEETAPLRLGRISSSVHLRNRIAYRDSTFELGSYDTLRWTENPDQYLRRSVGRELFEKRAFHEATGGRAPTLDLELIEFGEVRREGGGAGRIVVRYTVRDDTRVVDAGLVVVERDARGSRDMARIVESLAGALDETTAKIADAVVASLTPP